MGPRDRDADFLVVARSLGPRGLRGELKCLLVTDFPDRFRPGIQLHFEGLDRPLTVRSARVEAGTLYLRLEDVTSREQAEELRGREVLVPADQAVPLPPGQFLWRDVIGLEARDTTDRVLGRVTDVLRTGANDVYVIETPDGEMLVPAIAQIVRSIEPERGVMVVDPLPGMLPERREKRRRRARLPHAARGE